MNNSIITVLINGKPAKVYQHHNGLRYIEARNGTEYSLRIYNGSFQQRLAVVTVDGVNVISGQPQSNSGIGQGYIVNANQTLEIKGFRKDLNSVGAFKFCKASGSYCNEKEGLKGNNGIIGVRLYSPKIKYRISNEDYYRSPVIVPSWIPSDICKPINPIWEHSDNTYYDKELWNGSVTESTKSSQISTSSLWNQYKSNVSSRTVTKSIPDFDLGTTWGKKVEDKCINAEFDADENVFVEELLYYDSRENLESIGISFSEEKKVCLPQAFGGFAKPPKGWSET